MISTVFILIIIRDWSIDWVKSGLLEGFELSGQKSEGLQCYLSDSFYPRSGVEI